MISIDYKEHGVDAVMGCIETIRAGGEDEFLEYCGDGSIEMFGEDEDGREASGDASIYSIIDASGDAITDMQAQLTAERERAESWRRVSERLEGEKQALAAYVERTRKLLYSICGDCYMGEKWEQDLTRALLDDEPETSLAQRDAEQQKIGAASFKAELHEASSLPVRIHAEGVFAVWLHKANEIAAGTTHD